MCHLDLIAGLPQKNISNLTRQIPGNISLLAKCSPKKGLQKFGGPSLYSQRMFYISFNQTYVFILTTALSIVPNFQVE